MGFEEAVKATDVIVVLEGIITETGIEPAYVQCDNGPEFAAGEIMDTRGQSTVFGQRI